MAEDRNDPEKAKGTPAEKLWQVPPHWPKGVRRLALADYHNEFGINPATKELFFDGEPFVTKKRWADTERNIAYAGLLFAFVASASAATLAVIELCKFLSS